MAVLQALERVGSATVRRLIGGGAVEQFEGRTAVVTGAASGIGLGLARAFAGQGMRVVMADIEQGALDEAAQSLSSTGADIEAVRTDVSDEHSVRALAARTIERFGPVHILCNNAGVSVLGKLWDLTPQDWQWILGVNFHGVLHGIRAFVPGMLASGETGHIVNTGSVAGLMMGAPKAGAYSATKHGVVSLSESLLQELRAEGAPIGVSVICPSRVVTNIGTSERNRPASLSDTAHDREMRAALDNRPFSGPTPDELAATVLDAIRTDLFYIYPEQEGRPLIEAHHAAMIAGRI
jgi:NAD(P)-dependent dehydrogenase (short-subunit alcohol dehydrogenase family)